MPSIEASTVAPHVSVVTPLRNGAGTVGSAIASVRSQSFTDWELIVVDDGSTDGGADTARAHAAEGRLRLIRQPHLGVAAARNRGIDAARGAAIAFLDADDVWSPDYLRSMTAALAARPGAPLAFASWRYIDERGALLPQQVTPFGLHAGRAAAELSWRNALVTSAVAVLASAARDAGGFDASLRACEDWDLWLRLRAAGDFVAVPGALAFYRAHAGSLTEDVETMERERLRMNEKHHGAAQGDPARWPLDRRRAVGHTLFVSGLAHLRRREDERGRQKIRRAIEVWPGLIDEDELYYELACARQPRGRKGASSDLDLGESARLIEWVLPDGGGRSLPVRARLAIGNLALLGGGRRAARLHALAALGGGGGSRRRAALELLAAASLPAAVSGRLRAWRAGRQERAAEESAGPVSGVPA